MILDSIRKPDGDTVWVITFLTQSIEDGSLSATTSAEIYAVAATLQAAEDILDEIGPYLPRERILDVQILEVPMVERR